MEPNPSPEPDPWRCARCGGVLWLDERDIERLGDGLLPFVEPYLDTTAQDLGHWLYASWVGGCEEVGVADVCPNCLIPVEQLELFEVGLRDLEALATLPQMREARADTEAEVAQIRSLLARARETLD